MSSVNSSNRLGFVVIIVLMIVVVAMFVPLPNIPSLFQDDSYYNETINISITFPEEVEFSILLPFFLVEGQITPALDDLYRDQTQITFKTINSTRYVEINDTSALFGLVATWIKPNISGSEIAYESFLFDHSFEMDELGKVSIHLYATLTATIIYTLYAETNHCSTHPDGVGFYQTQIQPGRTIFSENSLDFTYLCA